MTDEDIIHYSGWAAQPDVRIDCDMSWTTPTWNQDSVYKPQAVHMSDDNRLYTFDPDLATCTKCREKIDLPNEIKGFFGKFRFLSNFHKCPVLFEGIEYSSTEAAYQATKTTDSGLRQVVADLAEPRYAKKMGRDLPLRSDWETIKLDIMYQVNLIKYQDKHLRDLLLGTRSANLEETNYWGDRFWGTCKGIGENNLGKILMKIRSELNNEAIHE